MEGGIFGLSIRDISLAIVSFLGAAMLWIFRNLESRLIRVEQNKLDTVAHEEKYNEVIRRLDAQDTAALRRDDKLDRILERVMK